MPELPEVETVCRSLSPHLVNRTLISCVVRNGSLRYKVSQDKMNHFISKQKIKELYRRAKYLIMVFESNQGLCMHLGMTGSFRIVTENTEFLKHEHISLTLDNKLELRYCDPRRFGFITNFDDAQKISHLNNLGPEPFDKKFSPKYISTSIINKSTPIKNLLMNNPFVVGIGNIYANEVLFRSKILPTRPSQSLSIKECTELYKSIIEVLTEAIDDGGSTIKDYRNPNGEEGFFAQRLNVYSRHKQPCHKCKSLISKEVIAGRSSFFCTSCQQ